MVSGNRLMAVFTRSQLRLHHVMRAIRRNHSGNPCHGGRFCLWLMSPVNCCMLSPEIRFLKYLGFLHRCLERREAFLHKADAPAKLFFRRQLRLSHRIMKLAPAHDPAYSHLRRHVGEAGDEHHRDSPFLDFFADRSAATRAGSSGGG